MEKRKQIVVASRNPKKVAELRTLLGDLGVELLSLADLPQVPEIEEHGKTFEANAILKAQAVAEASGLPALADDSGLVVDALGGAPGVRSARFAGEGAGDLENNRLLLERMEGIPEEKRTARFICVLAYVRPGYPPLLFRGETRGRILTAPRGKKGFGYDPLFLSEDLGITFGEASSEEKNRVSHRGRAFQAFREAWLRGDWDERGAFSSPPPSERGV